MQIVVNKKSGKVFLIAIACLLLLVFSGLIGYYLGRQLPDTDAFSLIQSNARVGIVLLIRFLSVRCRWLIVIA